MEPDDLEVTDEELAEAAEQAPMNQGTEGHPDGR